MYPDNECVLQHSDLSDDARSSVLQKYGKELHDAIRYKPDEEAGERQESLRQAPLDQVS